MQAKKLTTETVRGVESETAREKDLQDKLSRPPLTSDRKRSMENADPIRDKSIPSKKFENEVK